MSGSSRRSTTRKLSPSSTPIIRSIPTGLTRSLTSTGRARTPTASLRPAISRLKSKKGWNSMLNALANRNPDIDQLVKKGYAVGFDELHYLIVRDIFYLDN